MENLRWILIIAGVAILVLLYLSGRSAKPGASRRSHGSRDLLPSVDDQDEEDPLFGRRQEADRLEMSLDHDDRFADADEPPADVPVRRAGGARSSLPGDPRRESMSGGITDTSVHDTDASHGDDEPIDTDALWRDDDLEVRRQMEPEPTGGVTRGGIGRKIEAWSRKLRARTRSRNDEDDVDPEAHASVGHDEASQIIALHVEAPPGRLFSGSDLLEVFESRGYHFGDMNIFHSMHEGKAVFSIASMVEPGYFDIDAMHHFETPGVSMFMRLPGPVAADVAFEVFLSEAQDIADALDGLVLDAEHSSLSPQMIQHMREGIYEYMHRQRIHRSVPS